LESPKNASELYDGIARETITIFSRIVKEKKQVTPQTLSEMYAQNETVSSLFSRMEKQQEAPVDLADLDELKEALKGKDSEISEIEIRQKKKSEILLKVIRTLSILSKSENNRAINGLIEKLNEYIKTVGGPNDDLIEETLAELRREILNSENSGKQEAGRKRSLLGEIFKPGKAREGDASTTEKAVKDVLVSIVLRLQLQHADFDKKVHSIADEIRKKNELGELKDMKADICELIGSYRERLDDEKSNLYELIQEIASRLVDTEKELLHIFSENQATAGKCNSEFHECFDREIQGIEEGILQGTSIEGMRKIVFEKLGNIKASLQKKKELDMRLNEEAGGHIVQFNERLKSQEQEIRKVRESTDLDSLTGIYHRSAFQQELKEVFKECSAGKKPVSLIMFDLDNFRKINDRYTFDNGDRILQTIAKVVGDIKKEEYYFARYGGGEFALLVPDTMENARSFAEYLKTTIAGIDFFHLGEKVPVSISAGIAEFRGEKNPIQVLQKAHVALQESKKKGKNLVSIKK